MISGGMHSDYVRNLFLTGVVGLLFYLLFLLSLFLKSLLLNKYDRYLALSCLLALGLHSVSTTPLLYVSDVYKRQVLYRKKKGFCLPIQEWGSGIMLDFLDKHAVSFCRETNLLNESSITEQINRFKKNQGVNINDMFTLYYIINWYQQWLY